MKLIPLTQGKFAMVDDDAPTWIFDVKWRAQRIGQNFYAVRWTPRVDGKRRMILLHRVIANAPQGLEVDHIDGDGLNDQNTNLRICNSAENNRGFKQKRENTSSEFRGVYWHQQRGKWMAHIGHDGRRIYIGRFDDEIEAAKAFDAKARELGWPESGLNFPR